MSTTTVNITAAQVKELREKTNAPMMDCKQALTESKGDMEGAIVILRKKGVATAAKKATRATSEGSVTSYIHAGGKIGVLLEVNCESDFVARTDDFKTLVHDIAMHIAATDPRYIRKEDVTADAFEKEKDIYRAQAAQTGKPAPVIEKIVEGKMGKFYEEVCLYEQPFHQGPDHDRAPAYRHRRGQVGREHLGAAVCPLQSRRRRRDHRHQQSWRTGKRISYFLIRWNQGGTYSRPGFFVVRLEPSAAGLCWWSGE